MGRHNSRGRTVGRHRRTRSGGIRCYEIQAVAIFRRVHDLPTRRVQRHSWAFLARNGGTPRPAFALILSL
ncbi:MAG: hypothetical protein H0T40_16095 [Geodermatophilaceae bacterium]|nr:hypothetical protein [Geodermatophilaceae bacterium]